MSESSGLHYMSAPASSGWEGLRAALKRKDVELRTRTIKWLATLPAGVRPMRTARAYPRIVNKIGDLWGHCEYSRLHFQSLLIDRRPGRKGFPEDVREELVALQDYYFRNVSALPAVIWHAVPLKPVKIPDAIFPAYREDVEIEIPALPR
jgi:hypothetical protein